MRGGYRENAGRKKGFSAIEAERAREYIVDRVNKSLEPIITSLIEKAEKGDVSAVRILFDRAYGRPNTPIEMEIQAEGPAYIRLDE